MVSNLAELGERRIIDAIRHQYGYSWSDDDAAEIDIGKEYFIITTDSISQKSHMPNGASFESVGYFFAALNLSDIAAMGGKAKYFMTAFTLPKKMSIKDLKSIEKGMKRCLDKYGVRIIGGDLKQGSELNLAGIAIGAVSKKNILRRKGMKAGDLVCVTGSLGKNAAGYYMWKNNGAKRWAELLIEIEPRIKEGQFIALHGATSAIDLSDGVFSALSQLSRFNKLGFEIDLSKVPVHKEAKDANMKLGINIEDLALNFGGEYELLFTISKANFAKLHRDSTKKGIKVTAIGKVTGRKNFIIKNGKRVEIKKTGYEHFR